VSISWAIQHLGAIGCIGRGEFDTAVRRIGHFHLSAESAARVGREDRMQFADFVGRGGLSNLRAEGRREQIL
jgi:hypothetical protein